MATYFCCCIGGLVFTQVNEDAALCGASAFVNEPASRGHHGPCRICRVVGLAGRTAGGSMGPPVQRCDGAIGLQMERTSNMICDVTES